MSPLDDAKLCCTVGHCSHSALITAYVLLLVNITTLIVLDPNNKLLLIFTCCALIIDVDDELPTVLRSRKLQVNKAFVQFVHSKIGQLHLRPQLLYTDCLILTAFNLKGCLSYSNIWMDGCMNGGYKMKGTNG